MASLPPELEGKLEHVQSRFDRAEGAHKHYRKRWERLYALYRSYQDFRDAYKSSQPRDVYPLLQEGMREWGANLFIPYSFSTVETIVPRMLSNRPHMLILPKTQASEENAENMRLTLDQQQKQVKYELKCQDTAKSGLIYGLGVQKLGWRYESRQERHLVPSMNDAKKYVLNTADNGQLKMRERVLFDDWDAWDVDIFDFFFDPYAPDIPQAEYLLHRTWRSSDYCVKKVKSGAWYDYLSAEDIEGSGSTAKRDEVWAQRMSATGIQSSDKQRDQLHEVWEFHDGERVISVLDRQFVVQDGDNPCWQGGFPFYAYRPTTQGVGQIPGIGEIEPMEHLQAEMNTLRSQRRDNATLKLQQVFAYNDGAVDAADLKFGPGMAIPVTGEPRDLLMPINVGDIPNSGYQEEARLQSDIERVTGISDSVSGGEVGGAAQTATGVQLVQAAANMRIQNKTRRLEVEMITPAASYAVAMNQQKILEERDMRLPAPPQPGENHSVWAWRTIGPAELAGEFEVEVEGGSTAAENVPQMRADAQVFSQLFGQNPRVDQQRLLETILHLMGQKQTAGWLTPEEPRVPPATLDYIVEAVAHDAPQEVDAIKQVIGEALDRARQEEADGQSPFQQGSTNGALPPGSSPEQAQSDASRPQPAPA